jgi:hypothetical protein
MGFSRLGKAFRQQLVLSLRVGRPTPITRTYFWKGGTL